MPNKYKHLTVYSKEKNNRTGKNLLRTELKPLPDPVPSTQYRLLRPCF